MTGIAGWQQLWMPKEGVSMSVFVVVVVAAADDDGDDGDDDDDDTNDNVDFICSCSYS